MNQPLNESTSLSRATSLSRSTGNVSAKSRELIKKNIEMQGINSVDLLIERFTSWRLIVQQLVTYFKGIADIQKNTAAEMTKIAAAIQVPFHAGNQFLGEGGLQDAFYDIRDKSRQIADTHADLGRTVDSSIVQYLEKLLTEIKAHLKNIKNDTARLASNVVQEREKSSKFVSDLCKDVALFRSSPMDISPRRDPYITNQVVSRQLQEQILEENLFQKSIIMMQQNSAHFEEGIVRAIQSAWQTFDEWQSRASASNLEIYHSLTTKLSSVPPEREWISFAARSDHLLHPDTPLRDPALIDYPCKTDPSVFPLHTGHLGRKRKFTRSYHDSYYVLTPAGFLHGFDKPKPSQSSRDEFKPSFSLFLPRCTLGPPSAPNARSNKFYIEERIDGPGTTKTGNLRFFGGDAVAFRSRSREEMMEWWNDVRMLCARYLIASETVNRRGPVENAVRAVGYEKITEEEAGRIGAEETEGSSVEEEPEAEEISPPRYTYDRGYHGVEIGPHGYAIEKKYDTSVPEQHVHRDAHRRISIRQQEKAPEGRPAHAYDGPEELVTQDTTQAGTNHYEQPPYNGAPQARVPHQGKGEEYGSAERESEGRGIDNYRRAGSPSATEGVQSHMQRGGSPMGRDETTNASTVVENRAPPPVGSTPIKEEGTGPAEVQ